MVNDAMREVQTDALPGIDLLAGGKVELSVRDRLEGSAEGEVDRPLGRAFVAPQQFSG